MSFETSIPQLEEHDELTASVMTAEQEPSVLDLLIVLAERKLLILKVAAVFVVLGVGFALLLPKRYTAQVVVMPPAQNASLASTLASQLGNLGGLASMAGSELGVKSPNEMYISMLKSRTVEDAMVDQYGLAGEYHDRLKSDARKDFENHVSIDGAGKDGLIHISVVDHDPNRAAELANGYIRQFQALTDHVAITDASRRLQFFEQQMAQAKDNLANAEESLARTEQDTGIVQLDSQARALIESAASLRGQIAAKEVQIRSLQTFATDRNAQLIQAEQELDSMKAQLAQLGGSENIDSGLIVPKGKVPQAGMEYVQKLRDVKYYETIFEILARQFELAKLDQAKEGAPIQIIDAAVPPDKRSFPKRAVIVLIAAFAGLLVGCAWALFQVAVLNLKRFPEASRKADRLMRALAFRARASAHP